MSEDLLERFKPTPLVDAYALYQHLMDYWMETMQDDCYLLSADGWVAQPVRLVEKDKKGKEKDKGWACGLIPKPYIVARYFQAEQAALDATAAQLEAASAALAEFEEEHSAEDMALAGFDKINAAQIKDRIREIGRDPDAADELAVLKEWQQLSATEAALKKQLKDQDSALDKLAYEKYPSLSVDEIKTLVVDDKWLAALASSVQGELDRVSQSLTGRIRQLAERYASPLPALTQELASLSARVDEHLKKMGVAP
ncbi:hypothetical protein MASR1M90_08610 [Desulfovibrionales bacterium]